MLILLNDSIKFSGSMVNYICNIITLEVLQE